MYSTLSLKGAYFRLPDLSGSEMSHVMTKPTKSSVRPAKTQISLIRAFVVCSMGSWGPNADSEDSYQTGRMHRLIRVFAARKGNFVGFVIRWLRCFLQPTIANRRTRTFWAGVRFKYWPWLFFAFPSWRRPAICVCYYHRRCLSLLSVLLLNTPTLEKEDINVYMSHVTRKPVFGCATR